MSAALCMEEIIAPEIGAWPTPDRHSAARLLRAVRAAGEDRYCEVLGWAVSAMPSNIRLMRRHARHLLQAGDLDAAASIIARGLLARPSDPSFRLLRAALQLERGRTVAADRQLRLALRLRPHHLGTLKLSAEIACRFKDYDRSVALLQQALRLRPRDEHVRTLLVGALLDADEVREAEAAARPLGPLPLMLAVRLLRASGRLLDAADTLESALARGNSEMEQLDQCDKTAAMDELIDVLERIGDRPRLNATLRAMQVEHPAADLHGARQLIDQGEFEPAALMADELAHRPRWRREALHILAVAAAFTDQRARSIHALRELREHRDGLDAVILADLWRRAMHGRIVRAHATGQVESDPSASVLRPMLIAAIGTFQDELASPELVSADQEAAHAQQSELHWHRGVCLATLGRDGQTAHEFARSLELKDAAQQPAGLFNSSTYRAA